MNRQGFASMHISSRHLQQGLFASLTLMVTLIGGQQFARWEQVQAPEASYSAINKQQKHFTAIKSNALVTRVYDAGRFNLAAVEDTQIANSQPAQERWVF